MSDHPLDLARLRALMDAAGIGVELPRRAVACQQPAGSYRLVNGRNVVLCLGLSDPEAAYLAALLNAAPALLEMAEPTSLSLQSMFAHERQMRDAAVQRAEAAEARAQRLATLAKQATNGWACYASRAIEHKDIARLHRAIDAELTATTKEDK